MNIDAIMTKVQEFASTWAIVDGRFDDGTAMERAEQCKEEIRGMLADCAALDEQKAGPSDDEIIAAMCDEMRPIAEQKHHYWRGWPGTQCFAEAALKSYRALLSKYASPQPCGAKWDAEAAAIGRDKVSGLTRWNPLPGGGMSPHPSGLYVRAEDVPQVDSAPAPKGEPICYLNPKILGSDGRIGSHVRNALTWDREPIGGWTMPVYAAPVDAQDVGPSDEELKQRIEGALKDCKSNTFARAKYWLDQWGQIGRAVLSKYGTPSQQGKP